MTTLEALGYDLENLKSALEAEGYTMATKQVDPNTLSIDFRDDDGDLLQIGNFPDPGLTIIALPDFMTKQMILVNGITMERNWKLLFGFIVGYHD